MEDDFITEIVSYEKLLKKEMLWMIYVMSDIHGEYRKFITMLKTINFTDDDQLFIAGDVVDRGPEPLKVLFHTKTSRNIHLCMGNHERMLMDYYNTGKSDDMSIWYGNGGWITHRQMQEHGLESETVEYIKTLPSFFIVNVGERKFIISHAGYCMVEGYDTPKEMLEKTSDLDELVWSRGEFYERKAFPGYISIFGHTPVQLMPGGSSTEPKIWHDTTWKDKMDIDCGCCFRGGRLACLRLDDLKEFYVI